MSGTCNPWQYYTNHLFKIANWFDCDIIFLRIWGWVKHQASEKKIFAVETTEEKLIEEGDGGKIRSREKNNKM